MIRFSLSFVLFVVLGLPLASAATLKVDPAASEFRVDVKATGHSFELYLNSYQADISFDEGGAVERADFSFKCANLKSDNGKRDKKMLGWLEHETYSNISFELKDIVSGADGLEGHGELTMHGVSKPLVVSFTKEESAGKVTLRGSSMVDHREFGLDVITMFFMKVNPELNISFTLVGTLEQ